MRKCDGEERRIKSENYRAKLLRLLQLRLCQLSLLLKAKIGKSVASAATSSAQAKIAKSVIAGNHGITMTPSSRQKVKIGGRMIGEYCSFPGGPEDVNGYANFHAPLYCTGFFSVFVHCYLPKFAPIMFWWQRISMVLALLMPQFSISWFFWTVGGHGGHDRGFVLHYCCSEGP